MTIFTFCFVLCLKLKHWTHLKMLKLALGSAKQKYISYNFFKKRHSCKMQIFYKHFTSRYPADRDTLVMSWMANDWPQHVHDIIPWCFVLSCVLFMNSLNCFYHWWVSCLYKRWRCLFLPCYLQMTVASGEVKSVTNYYIIIIIIIIIIINCLWFSCLYVWFAWSTDQF